MSGACVGPCPSFDRPPSLHALRPRPVGRCCSRLHRYYTAVRLLIPSDPASAPRLSEPARDRRGDCGRPPRFRRVPFGRNGVFDHGRAVAPRMTVRNMLPSTFSTVSAPANLYLSRLNNPLHSIAVYASPWSSPSTPQHSLPGGRYSLPGPDLHRLDRTSFAWRTTTYLFTAISFAATNRLRHCGACMVFRLPFSLNAGRLRCVAERTKDHL